MTTIRMALIHSSAPRLQLACLLVASVVGSGLALAQDTKDTNDAKVSKTDAEATPRDDSSDPSYRVPPANAARERVAIETYLKSTLDEYWTAKKGLDQAAAMSKESEWQAI